MKHAKERFTHGSPMTRQNIKLYELAKTYYFDLYDNYDHRIIPFHLLITLLNHVRLGASSNSLTTFS